jgi:hypothetical protein
VDERATPSPDRPVFVSAPNSKKDQVQTGAECWSGNECWNGNGGQMTTRRQTAATRNSKVRVEKLNKAAFALVNENATEIAASLLKSTIEGHVLSARLLVELAEGNVSAEEALMMRPLRSLALQLEADSRLPIDSPDAAAEKNVDEPSTGLA